MLKAPPPLFDFGVDRAAGQDRTAVRIMPGDDSDRWYGLANDIANAIYDARTLAEVEAVKTRNLEALRDLTAHRRDLAELLSAAFADRRTQLGSIGS